MSSNYIVIKSDVTDIDEVWNLFQRVNNKLNKIGILQWNDIYPTIDYFFGCNKIR